MTASSLTSPDAPERSRMPGARKQRARAAGSSTVAATATWIVADLIPGVDVTVPAFDSTSQAVDLGLGAVVAATAVATLLGWALLAVLERSTTRPKALWTSAAIAVAVVSLAGPMSGTGVDTSQRSVLVGFHLIVAAFYVPLMQRTIPASHGTQP